MPLLNVALVPAPDQVVVRLTGDADLSSAPQLGDALAQAGGLGTRQVVVDVAGVRFWDLSGLARADRVHRGPRRPKAGPAGSSARPAATASVDRTGVAWPASSLDGPLRELPAAPSRGRLGVRSAGARRRRPGPMPLIDARRRGWRTATPERRSLASPRLTCVGPARKPAPAVTASVFDARMGEIVVLRHGQTEWSRSGQHTGVTDLPLLPEGEEQARAPARRVLGGRRFAEVWVSPRQRAGRTAELAGLAPTRRRRRPGRGRLRRLRGPDDGGDQRGARPRVVGLAGRHGARRDAGRDARRGRRAGGPRARPRPGTAGRRRRRAGRARPRAARADRPLARPRAPEAGALFALPAGSYGVLGHEHARPVLTAWGLH